jgi:hypothetical protein
MNVLHFISSIDARSCRLRESGVYLGSVNGLVELASHAITRYQAVLRTGLHCRESTPVRGGALGATFGAGPTQMFIYVSMVMIQIFAPIWLTASPDGDISYGSGCNAASIWPLRHSNERKSQFVVWSVDRMKSVVAMSVNHIKPCLSLDPGMQFHSRRVPLKSS